MSLIFTCYFEFSSRNVVNTHSWISFDHTHRRKKAATDELTMNAFILAETMRYFITVDDPFAMTQEISIETTIEAQTIKCAKIIHKNLKSNELKARVTIDGLKYTIESLVNKTKWMDDHKWEGKVFNGHVQLIRSSQTINSIEDALGEDYGVSSVLGKDYRCHLHKFSGSHKNFIALNLEAIHQLIEEQLLDAAP